MRLFNDNRATHTDSCGRDHVCGGVADVRKYAPRLVVVLVGAEEAYFNSQRRRDAVQSQNKPIRLNSGKSQRVLDRSKI